MTLAETTKPKRTTPRKTIKAVIPPDDFTPIFEAAKKVGHAEFGCGSAKAYYALKECKKKIGEWWERVNGDAPGLCHYELVFIKAMHASAGRNRLPEDKLRACFIPRSPYTAEYAYGVLAEMVRQAFRQ